MDNHELVRGGQGRSAEDVISSAVVVLAAIVIGVVAFFWSR